MWILKTTINFWLITVAIWDVRRRKIPNWLTLPVMLAAGGYRLYEKHWSLLIAWVILFTLWEMHIIGGGDAKLLMGLYALFPDRSFTLMLAVSVLITSVPYLIAKYRGHSLASLLKGATNRVRTGNAWPTRDELQERGRSLAWTYCLPGMVYLWLLW